MFARQLNSIRGRLVLASCALLPLIFGALSWSLERAFSNSILDNQQRQMTLQTYALMASAELQNDALWLPEHMSDDQLNQISSDTFAVVINGQGQIQWRSLSASDKPIYSQALRSDINAGDSLFTTLNAEPQDLFVFQYAIEWENEQGTSLPFQFVVYESQTGYLGQLNSYRHTLWVWLGGITVILLVMQLLILRWGLKPLHKMTNDLSSVRRGNEARLIDTYPQELEAVTESINQLLEHEEHQRDRYRNTLANLAHSIKNPVAIMASELSTANQNKLAPTHLLQELSDQTERINQIVSYQLTRAVSGAATPFSKAILIKPICEQVCNALQKVYIGKPIDVSINVDTKAAFKGDKGDLMELIGNLLDNACKYGQRRVQLTATGNDKYLSLCIENDGMGLSKEQRQVVMERGERADTAAPGQGIGLAVVKDIVRSYEGELTLKESELGGLKVIVRFGWIQDNGSEETPS